MNLEEEKLGIIFDVSQDFGVFLDPRLQEEALALFPFDRGSKQGREHLEEYARLSAREKERYQKWFAELAEARKSVWHNLDRRDRKAEQELKKLGYSALRKPNGSFELRELDGSAIGSTPTRWTYPARRQAWYQLMALHQTQVLRDALGKLGDQLTPDVDAALALALAAGELSFRAQFHHIEPEVLTERKQAVGWKKGHNETFGTNEWRAERNDRWTSEAQELRAKPRFSKAGARTIAEEIARTTTLRRPDGRPYGAETIRRVIGPALKDRG